RLFPQGRRRTPSWIPVCCPRRRSICQGEYKCPSARFSPGWMAVAIGPGSHAESFIWAATLCARRAGRSAEDRLLCKQEVLGSNPSRSTQPQAGGLYARVQSVRELVRQVRLPDLSRNRLDVVRHAPHLERPSGEIEEAPGGLRVSVSGLADGPGVHEQAGSEGERHRQMRMAQDDEGSAS